MHEGRKQTNTGPAHAGSRLKLTDALGRRRPKCHPSSRTGENPPYGMIGGIEETSASFEARSAPRSYPTWACHSSNPGARDCRHEHYGDRVHACSATPFFRDITLVYQAAVDDAAVRKSL